MKGKGLNQTLWLATVLALCLVVGGAGAAKGAVLRSDKLRLVPDASGVETAERVRRQQCVRL